MANIKLIGLRKIFQHIVVVDDLTLDIADGELVALLGPSGCGKTTTLRMIAGFEPPTTGEIYVGGQLLSSPTLIIPPEKRRMSMIFQSYAVWPHLTVFENVAFGVRLRTRDKSAIQKRVKAALEVVRLEQLADRYPNQLSGGQQQRVSLARALVVEPTTLLLDEPLSNLDASLREEMRFEIRRLHNEYGITSVYVTHDLSEAMVTSDRIAVMNAGRIEQVGTAEDIYERPLTRFVANFIGTNNVLECPFIDGRAMLGGVAFEVAHGQVPCDGERRAQISIRPRDIEILPFTGEYFGSTDEPSNRANIFNGVIRRVSFLGEFRDYLIAIPGTDIELRAATSPAQRLQVDQRIRVRLPAQCCRYVLGEASHSSGTVR